MIASKVGPSYFIKALITLIDTRKVLLADLELCVVDNISQLLKILLKPLGVLLKFLNKLLGTIGYLGKDGYQLYTKIAKNHENCLLLSFGAFLLCTDGTVLRCLKILN